MTSMARIKTYLDCVSPYSYYAFTFLNKHREALKSHDVSVEFVPIFLRGVNVATGNQPPGTLPAKAAYLAIDIENAKRYFGLSALKKPSVFPVLTVKPQRGLIYIKNNFPEETYIEAFRLLWVSLWEQNKDISQEAQLAETWSGLFKEEELKRIIEATGKEEYKDALMENTNEAVQNGAFGVPWSVVRNAKGEETRFFGSDRFHFMWEFLGIGDGVGFVPSPKSVL
ncbi:thioredoxin-like protein [Choiromyces venosus 120613-1]|uniref:Glutathione S-transferase kappa n=1 Tax=Choiromyces venosus 120613-1 TaxID=1336337 RepID=A0A3N4JGW6_9PEZI|nr:thioredoxin-like protein [Choiromyces venosus 120613-1]